MSATWFLACGMLHHPAHHGVGEACPSSFYPASEARFGAGAGCLDRVVVPAVTVFALEDHRYFLSGFDFSGHGLRLVRIVFDLDADGLASGVAQIYQQVSR